MNKKRARTPTDVENEVLIRSRRRCSICYGWYRDLALKRGQIAHVDRNPGNPDIDNLVFLCLDHHDEYDSRTSQSKGLSTGEILHYRRELYEAISGTPEWIPSDQPEPEPQTPSAMAAEDVLNQRLKMYRAVRDFLHRVLATADPSVEDIQRFGSETDEAALFYDDSVAERLDTIRRNAIRLRQVGRRLRDMSLPVGEERNKLAEEDAELLLWFETQLVETVSQMGIRIRFG